MATAGRVLKVMGLGRTLSYRRWAKVPLYTGEELEAQRGQVFDRRVLFSIITPLYNTREDYLREMIESVRAQTYSGWELCMADGSDGEHDEVGRICREYAKNDPRIKYRKLEKNQGICGNSNACMDMASGEYFGLLDHDDVLHPAALHDVMEAVCGQDADISACQYIVQGKQEFTIYKPIIQLAEVAAECAVRLARKEDISENRFRIRPINNGFGDIPTIWLEPSYVDKYNLDKLIIESGFHSAASIYKD